MYVEYVISLRSPGSICTGWAKGKIDVVPAFGRRSMQNPGDVLAKLARAYAGHVPAESEPLTLYDQVRSIVDQLADPNRYEAVLVDARAGLNEATPSAILGLGAEVFLFGLNDNQTFDGYSALFAHLDRLSLTADSRRELFGRLTMVQGKAPTNAAARSIFQDRCKALFSIWGLDGTHPPAGNEIPLPAEPFGDVPWDDSIDDDTALQLADSSWRESLSILEDERFRSFDPLSSRDQITEQAYLASFGPFLDFFRSAIPAEITENR
jgi:hypothetical protein